MWASHGTVRKAFDSPVAGDGERYNIEGGLWFRVLSRSVQRLCPADASAGRGKHLCRCLLARW